MPDITDLLGEIATLKAMLIASEARNLRKDERIERLGKLVAAFKQAAFGRRSEKSGPDQFELALEDLETAIATVHEERKRIPRIARQDAPLNRVPPIVDHCPNICRASKRSSNRTA